MPDTNFRVLRFDEIAVGQNRAEAVARTIRAGNSGEQTLGVWLPMIGMSVNTVTAITNWSTEPPKADYNSPHIKSVRTRLFDSQVESRLIDPGWLVEAAQLAHELKRGCSNLVVGCRGLEVK